MGVFLRGKGGRGVAYVRLLLHSTVHRGLAHLGSFARSSLLAQSNTPSFLPFYNITNITQPRGRWGVGKQENPFSFSFSLSFVRHSRKITAPLLYGSIFKSKPSYRRAQNTTPSKQCYLYYNVRCPTVFLATSVLYPTMAWISPFFSGCISQTNKSSFCVCTSLRQKSPLACLALFCFVCLKFKRQKKPGCMVEKQKCETWCLCPLCQKDTEKQTRDRCRYLEKSTGCSLLTVNVLVYKFYKCFSIYYQKASFCTPSFSFFINSFCATATTVRTDLESV